MRALLARSTTQLTIIYCDVHAYVQYNGLMYIYSSSNWAMLCTCVQQTAVSISAVARTYDITSYFCACICSSSPCMPDLTCMRQQDSIPPDMYLYVFTYITCSLRSSDVRAAAQSETSNCENTHNSRFTRPPPPNTSGKRASTYIRITAAHPVWSIGPEMHSRSTTSASTRSAYGSNQATSDAASEAASLSSSSINAKHARVFNFLLKTIRKV